MTPEERAKSKAKFAASVESSKPVMHLCLDTALKIGVHLQAISCDNLTGDETTTDMIPIDTLPMEAMLTEAGFILTEHNKLNFRMSLQHLLLKSDGYLDSCFVWDLAHTLDHVYTETDEEAVQH